MHDQAYQSTSIAEPPARSPRAWRTNPAKFFKRLLRGKIGLGAVRARGEPAVTLSAENLPTLSSFRQTPNRSAMRLAKSTSRNRTIDGQIGTSLHPGDDFRFLHGSQARRPPAACPIGEPRAALPNYSDEPGRAASTGPSRKLSPPLPGYNHPRPSQSLMSDTPAAYLSSVARLNYVCTIKGGANKT